MARNPSKRAELHLVAACQAKNGAAWKKLRTRLVAEARRVLPHALGRDVVNKALVEDIIANVLDELFLNRQLLAACQTSKGDLDGFLDYLLHRAVHHHYQELSRRRRQQARLAERIVLPFAVPDELKRFQEELWQLLTRAEQKYLAWRQLLPEENVLCPFVPSYAQQLEQRILAEARRLIFEDGKS